MIEVLLTSSVLILALALLRRGLRGRIDPRLQYALWLLVVLRLLIPGSLFPAPLTVSGALSDWEASRAADDTVPASAADPPAQSPAAGAPSQPTGADVTVLPVLGPLYDVYTEEKDFPLGTSPDQWLQEAPGEDYTVNGVEVDLERGKQTVTYSQYDSVWSMPFWRWPLYAGTALAGTILLLSNLKFYLSLRKRRRRIPPSELPTACGARVYLAEGLASPCLVGLLRPAIYLNEAALDPGRLEHILVHEETHRRHGDQLWGLARGVCLALYWYDPLVWWAAVLSRRDCELACDHSAIRRLGEDRRLDYGQTLVSMIVPGRPLTGLLRTATTMSEGKRTVKERIALIVHRPRMLKVTLAAVAVIVAAVVVLTFGGSWEDAQAEAGAVEDPAETGGAQPAPGIAEAEAPAFYQEARTAWDWFETGSLPTTEEVLDTADSSYLRVDGFNSLAELEDYLLTLFTPELTSYLLTSYQPLQETTDGLFVLPGGRGTSIYAGEEDVRAFIYTEAEAERYGCDGHVTASTEVLGEDLSTVLYNKRHDWSFVWNGENYVFTSFGPWDDGDPQVYYNAQEIMARIQQGDDPSTWLPLLENMDWGAMARAGGEDYDLCAEVQGALYDYITDHGETLTEDEYRYILSASEGLDGAYAEGYQYDVWRLYLAQPPQFAQVVEELTAEHQARIVDFFRYEEANHRDSEDYEPMTAEEALEFLQISSVVHTTISNIPILSSTTYDHPSGMFSLSLPEEWVGNVLCLDTEDGVTFMETNIYEPAGHYRTLARVVPEPTSWVENNLSENMISLGSFDTNGVPHQYVLRHLSSDPSAENALASSDPIVTLLSQRDQIGFRSSVTPELIDQLVHDSYESDMAAAIAYLPYLSWSSYRDTYGESDTFSLLSALREYTGSGQADWGQYHNILSVPVDSAIDGAYATTYQDVLWALYDSNPEYFAGVLGSDYITDAERNNAVYWLRAPLAWADGREEPLSDNAVRQRLGLPTDAGTSETGLTDGEVINGYGRALGPAVAAVPAHPGGEVIWNTPIVSTPEEAILLTLEEHGRSYLGDNFSQILLEDITYSPPEEDAYDEATVSYRVQAATTFTLPSGSPYTLTMETGLLTSTFTLTSRYEILLDGAARWSLASCFEFTEIPVSVGTDADPRQLILDTINANMDAEGVTGYEISLELSSQPDLSSLSVGDRAEVSYDFSAEGEFSLDGTREIAFVITE